MSDSLWPHGLQHARHPCPLLFPRVCSNSCPLSWCCHQRSHLLLPLSLSTLSLFQHQDFFSSESALCVRWPKDWSYSFSISPSNEYSGSISFRIDSFDLFAIRGTLNSLLQPHSLKASIVSLTVWTFVGKVMSLLFNMLSRFVIAFLPRSKRLLTSWLQSPSAVILDPKKIQSATVSIVSPFICLEVMGPDRDDLSFLNVEF